MPGPIAHLVIADKVINKFPKGIINKKNMYYNGVLAPDAIHAKVGFKREDKKRTHFRIGITDEKFHLKENQEIFQSRIKDFIDEYFNRADGLEVLYLGYLVHILTDESFILTLRREFTIAMEQEGILQSDRAYYDKIIHDLESNDNRLFISYESIEEIKQSLKSSDSYDVEGYLTNDELTIGRLWVINKFTNEDISDPVYISVEKFKEFINLTVDYIVEKLISKIETNLLME